MAGNSDPKPSFTAGRKWGMALHVFILVLVVFSVVAMVNYLSRDFYLRANWSSRTKWKLSPRTVQYIASITNQVRVTVYYRKDDQLFSTIIELLKEYRGLNHRIEIETVDYQRDPATAQKIKTTYKLGTASEKDLVIFDSAGVVFPVDGKWLADREIETIQGGKERSYRYKITAFRGETLFTGAFMKVTSPVRRKAYMLQGHGEHRMDSSQEHFGYIKFASVVGRNCVEVQPLSLLGTNPVPVDCDLLIIAGPSVALTDSELEKIDKYLDQGGRLFSLFNADSLQKVTGLERILKKWGVTVGTFVVRDPNHSAKGADIAVGTFTKHVMVAPLILSGLDLIQPRPIWGPTKDKDRARAADAPRVEEVAFTSDEAYADPDPNRKHRPFPLIVTVEKGAIEGVTAGTTRIVVVGDSYFLSDEMIDIGANADFVDGAVNWLLDRPELLKGIGPRRVDSYLLEMTNSQMQVAELLLLAGMPGSVLALGVLVWLSRRK